MGVASCVWWCGEWCGPVVGVAGGGGSFDVFGVRVRGGGGGGGGGGVETVAFVFPRSTCQAA